MAKQLKNAEQDPRVFSIIQSQIDSQRSNVETAQMLLNEVCSVRDEVHNVKKEVNKRFDEMTEMVQEVRDSVTLTNAECTQIHSAVATKSILLTKDRYSEEDGSFSKVVGAHRRMIWKNLKHKYDVPKYNCIRRVDHGEALYYVQSFRPEEYI